MGHHKHTQPIPVDCAGVMHGDDEYAENEPTNHRTMLDALYLIAKRCTLTLGQSPDLALEDIKEYAKATTLVIEASTSDLLGACENMVAVTGGSDMWQGKTHTALKRIEDAIAVERGNQ